MLNEPKHARGEYNDHNNIIHTFKRGAQTRWFALVWAL